MVWLGYVVGFACGVAVGMVIMGCLVAASRDSEGGDDGEA